MGPLGRSRRRGMIVGATIASSRANKRAAQQAQSAQSQPAQQQAATPSTDDAIEQIKKLAELRNQGILTDAEFDVKKKKLLGL